MVDKKNKPNSLIGFLKTKPNLKDEEVHSWAKKHGYKVDKVEERIYSIASKCLRRKK